MWKSAQADQARAAARSEAGPTFSSQLWLLDAIPWIRGARRREPSGLHRARLTSPAWARVAACTARAAAATKRTARYGRPRLCSILALISNWKLRGLYLDPSRWRRRGAIRAAVRAGRPS